MAHSFIRILVLEVTHSMMLYFSNFSLVIRGWRTSLPLRYHFWPTDQFSLVTADYRQLELGRLFASRSASGFNSISIWQCAIVFHFTELIHCTSYCCYLLSSFPRCLHLQGSSLHQVSFQDSSLTILSCQYQRQFLGLSQVESGFPGKVFSFVGISIPGSFL